MSYECFACETERPVVVIMTSLETGFTMASCREDLPVGLVGSLATELGVDASKLYANIERFVKRQQDEAAKAAKVYAAELAAAEGQPDHDYEDGNTDYGREDADELAAALAGEDEDQAVAK